MPEVLLEECPSCDGMKRPGDYICQSCRSEPRAPMILAADEPEYLPKRYNKAFLKDSICGNCIMFDPCQERVKNGMWVYCEIPSEEDVLILEIRSEL